MSGRAATTWPFVVTSGCWLCHARLGDRINEVRALVNSNLGCAHVGWVGACRQASEHLHQSLALARTIGGTRAAEAYALSYLQGDAEKRLASCQQATVYYLQALAMFREFGARTGEVEALNGLGEVLMAIGQPGDALTWHTTALSLADQIGCMDADRFRRHFYYATCAIPVSTPNSNSDGDRYPSAFCIRLRL